MYPILSIRSLCLNARVSRSGFGEWYSREISDPTVDEFAIIELFVQSKGKFGVRRLKMAFERKFNRPINHKKIRRIKKKYGLITVIRRPNKFRAVFKQGEEHAIAPNLVKRDFDSEKYIILSTDITELRYASGQKAYLSAVKDLRTKEIVTYKLGRHPSLELAICDLPERLKVLPLKIRKKIIVHSDQGGQYGSSQFSKPIMNLKVRVSMSRKANCLDNAPIESFFGHLKDEADLAECRTYLELEKCVNNYMKYYNYDRPQWDLKRKTPAEAGVGKSLVY